MSLFGKIKHAFHKGADFAKHEFHDAERAGSDFAHAVAHAAESKIRDAYESGIDLGKKLEGEALQHLENDIIDPLKETVKGLQAQIHHLNVLLAAARNAAAQAQQLAGTLEADAEQAAQNAADALNTLKNKIKDLIDTIKNLPETILKELLGLMGDKFARLVHLLTTWGDKFETTIKAVADFVAATKGGPLDPARLKTLAGLLGTVVAQVDKALAMLKDAPKHLLAAFELLTHLAADKGDPAPKSAAKTALGAFGKAVDGLDAAVRAKLPGGAALPKLSASAETALSAAVEAVPDPVWTALAPRLGGAAMIASLEALATQIAAATPGNAPKGAELAVATPLAVTSASISTLQSVIGAAKGMVSVDLEIGLRDKIGVAAGLSEASGIPSGGFNMRGLLGPGVEVTFVAWHELLWGSLDYYLEAAKTALDLAQTFTD